MTRCPSLAREAGERRDERVGDGNGLYSAEEEDEAKGGNIKNLISVGLSL